MLTFCRRWNRVSLTSQLDNVVSICRSTCVIASDNTEKPKVSIYSIIRPLCAAAAAATVRMDPAPTFAPLECEAENSTNRPMRCEPSNLKLMHDFSFLFQANLPLLQQELQTTNTNLGPVINGRRSASPRSPPTPGAVDPRIILPVTVRPPEQRHPLWYLGPLPSTGRGNGSGLVQSRCNGLDFNANGKRPSAFDR